MKTIVVLLGLLMTASAQAGSICGTVRDQQTQQPVAAAGVFLYTAAGSFSGQATATDANGAYCLDGVAPGTYTLEFRRDDYLMSTVSDVLVEGVSTSIDVDVSTAVLFGRVWPNPTSGSTTFRFRVTDGRPLTLRIFDLRGRNVRSWRGVGSGADRDVVWDGRTDDGRALSSGTFFAVLRSGDLRVSQRLTVLD